MNNLNDKIKSLYLDWLLAKKCFAPISTSNPRQVKWTLWEYSLTQSSYRNKTKKDCLGIEPNQSFIKDFKKVNFLGNAKDWLSEGCIFEDGTEKYHTKELFFHIYDNLNLSEKKQFLSMCTRLFKAGSVMDFLQEKKEIFHDWISLSPAGYAGMMSHEDMAKFFKVFERIYANNKEKETILYKYLENRKKMGKRIETQQILNSYINNFIKDKEKFKVFLDKLSNIEFFKTQGKVVSFNVDKIGFYNAVNPSGKPIPKYDMTELLLALMLYINNSQEEKKRLFLNQFVMLNKDSEFKYYTIIFDSLEDNPQIDYYDFFEKVLPSCSELVGKPILQSKGFKAAITRYFMEIRIPEKEGVEKAVKRVKI